MLARCVETAVVKAIFGSKLTLPRERTRSDMHTHPNYYPLRNHLVEFLVNRSKRFQEELASSSYDPRNAPTVRPAAGLTQPGIDVKAPAQRKVL